MCGSQVDGIIFGFKVHKVEIVNAETKMSAERGRGKGIGCEKKGLNDLDQKGWASLMALHLIMTNFYSCAGERERESKEREAE